MENEAFNEVIINGFYYSVSATIATSLWNINSSAAGRLTALYTAVCFLSFCSLFYVTNNHIFKDSRFSDSYNPETL
jgi:hypothetical protein